MKLEEINGSYVYGEWVLTPCKNVENNNTSYWLSRKGYAKAVYSFTPICKRDTSQKGMIEHIEATIPLFENMGAKQVVNAQTSMTNAKCSWCENGDCTIRDGDDTSCTGDAAEMEECAYV